MSILIVPGYGGSGPDHWQSRWQAMHADCIRVEQADWDAPDLDDWIDRLDAAVAAAGPGVKIAAHSLGCLLVAHWAARSPRAIAGALLVAVPDPQGAAFPPAAAGFGPAPTAALPFAATVIASRDDPYAGWAFSEGIARNWGATLIDAGTRGHLNADSALGDWAEGWCALHGIGLADAVMGPAQWALLARYNAVMNAKVYAAAASLSEAELMRDRGAFFGSLFATLNHLVVGDTMWLKRFAAHPATDANNHAAVLAPVVALPMPAGLDAIVCADLPALAARRALLDHAIGRWVGALTPALLAETLHYTRANGAAYSKRLGDVLLHFFNHQTHHRGQASTLLSQAGVDIGVTDLAPMIADVE
ncbi:alpha/beta hydrolase [Jeongeupia wiesaeckerbachi]|uniref:DinB family protein n=1 Tax=Jeongeupia wiesaeckerbachi TaxID=3051218 RepID=UPI003D8076B9